MIKEDTHHLFFKFPQSAEIFDVDAFFPHIWYLRHQRNLASTSWTHAQRRTTAHLQPPCTHWPSSESWCTHRYTPKRRVIQQTLLADWNRERINSRWYHWEKMEHNVEICSLPGHRRPTPPTRSRFWACGATVMLNVCPLMYMLRSLNCSSSPYIFSLDDVSDNYNVAAPTFPLFIIHKQLMQHLVK